MSQTPTTGSSGRHTQTCCCDCCRYGGLNDPSQGQCAANYPAGAPRHICGHVSFVELDGQMSFKQALAFWATGHVRHARTALRIMSGWAAVNKVFGPALDGNGPLEAAWVSRAAVYCTHGG
jgi:hypothetical protein